MPVNYSLIEAGWEDKPVAIIGCGPSLTGINFELIKGFCRVIAVKSAIFDFPWADLGFGLDTPDLRRWWFRFNQVHMRVCWAVDPNFTPPCPVVPKGMKFVKRTTEAKLSEDSGTIHGGGTSGFGAINLAWLKDAREIYLFGFDYRSLGGRWHLRESYYRARRYHIESWKQWAKNFEQISDKLKANGVDVINASPQSAIEAFPKCSIAQAIESIRS